ncbi:MAG: MBL fold metallo-hydrolase, partial [Nocardioidaceae bacterium]
VCTHAHDDHVRVAPELAQAVEAPVLLHPDDAPVWALTHPHVQPDGPLSDGRQIVVADIALTVLHTPGHSPGSVCLYSPDLGSVCTGDTLFKGGPGATGRSFSDHDTILASIRSKLLTLPPETAVHTGHGESTTIGAEQ